MMERNERCKCLLCKRADAIRFALVTPDEYDVSLRARTERVNTWCRQLGKRNVCLISIHTNAAGNGKQWMNVRG